MPLPLLPYFSVWIVSFAAVLCLQRVTVWTGELESNKGVGKGVEMGVRPLFCLPASHGSAIVYINSLPILRANFNLWDVVFSYFYRVLQTPKHALGLVNVVLKLIKRPGIRKVD